MIDKIIQEKSFEWAKKNRKQIVKNILKNYDKENFKWRQIIFLSWSPWAWKTEVINWMLKKWFDKYFLHIDLDELRKIIPYYNWYNSDSIQKWAIRIIEHLLDKAFKLWINIILDWTFWSRKASIKNIEKAISKWYNIKIYYIKFNPIIAWKYTVFRELEWKRKVPLLSFYKQYYNSFSNIEYIIKKYKNIKLIILEKLLTKNWHSSKIHIITTYKEFQKIKNSIKPKEIKIILLIKLLLYFIYYKYLNKKYYE